MAAEADAVGVRVRVKVDLAGAWAPLTLRWRLGRCPLRSPCFAGGAWWSWSTGGGPGNGRLREQYEKATHPNDDDVHFRISDDKIFTDIFHYLEVLFRIIKPRKVFFMAVDGVAPRAKMNQQRGRRFR